MQAYSHSNKILLAIKGSEQYIIITRRRMKRRTKQLCSRTWHTV